MIAEILHKIAAEEYASKEGQAYRPRPSLAGPERCIRQLAYMAGAGEGEKKPLPGRAVMVMDDSSWHADLTLNWLRKSGYTVHSEEMEIEIEELKGSVDAVITDLLGNDYVLEHKAIAHFSWESFAKKEKLPLDYLTQLALYIRGIKKVNPEISKGILLLKNKNQSGYLDYLCELRGDNLHILTRANHLGEVTDLNEVVLENVIANAFEKFRIVEEYKKAGTLPDRQYEIDSWRCDYCPYTQTCWSGWQKEHENLAIGIELEGEIADLIRYRQEVSAHEGEMRKEKDELTEKIKNILKEKGIRSGKAGEYVVSWQVSPFRKLRKEDVPAEYYDESFQERLVIRKTKEDLCENSRK